MSDESTKRLIKAYVQNAPATMFLTGLCVTPPENFYASEKVMIDIVRHGEDIAVTLKDLSAGYRYSASNIYTNKEYLAPIYQQAIPVNSFDLLKRVPGQNPFGNPDYRANLILLMFQAFREEERKIRRSIELQSSQVFQTGTVSLVDENGAVLYTLDYQPKSTHFPTSAVAWDQTTSTKIQDLNSLSQVIRKDGLCKPNELHFGIDAFEEFIKDDDVIARFDNRRYDLGSIIPMEMRGEGGNYRGSVEIGNYRYNIYTYDGEYKHPQTGTITPYLSPKKVIMRDSNGRIDLCYGAIPNIGKLMGGQANSILQELPGRISNYEGGMDLSTNAWLSIDGQQIFCGVACRPIVIPTAIDTFGCLDTGL